MNWDYRNTYLYREGQRDDCESCADVLDRAFDGNRLPHGGRLAKTEGQAVAQGESHEGQDDEGHVKLPPDAVEDVREDDQLHGLTDENDGETCITANLDKEKIISTCLTDFKSENIM